MLLNSIYVRQTYNKYFHKTILEFDLNKMKSDILFLVTYFHVCFHAILGYVRLKKGQACKNT